jgi:hypothetical protein
MDDYRLYLLDQSGHIVRARYVSASDEKDAIQRASQTAESERWELWTGTRMIARVIDSAA